MAESMPTASDSSHGPTLTSAPQSTFDANHASRPKRIACVICRRKKLRCDGERPSCGTCSRLKHACTYDDVHRKRGPKPGYTKQLEARLAQVETLVRSQESDSALPFAQIQEDAIDTAMPDEANIEMADVTGLPDDVDSSLAGLFGPPQPTQAFLPGAGLYHSDTHTWDMISLGLEEPLPTQDVIDELHQIYFEKIHPSIPIIHTPRYMAALNLAPHVRPPVCLRYMIWCHAAAVTDKYSLLHQHFYQRARKYAEMDDMKGMGEKLVSIAVCQCWVLTAIYEFKMMYLPRAWVNVGRALRLALMMGLHRQDGVGVDVKQSISPAKDWTEKEERRRTFWMAFCSDRYASIGNGWPMMIDERDIMTDLPATDEAFLQGQPQQTMRLADILAGDGISSLSSYGAVVVLACLFGRNLTHLHRPDPLDNEHDLNGEFWKRHRAYDNILLKFALSLPNHLRLSHGISDPNVIYCNMSLQTSAICLHQAAIFKAEKNKLPTHIAAESKRRCIVAADQISSIMKMISHTDLGTMNPFMWFCVYVSARVFVQYLSSRPDDSSVRSSLQFVVSAFKALKHKSPLNESFLAQLRADVEATHSQDILPDPGRLNDRDNPSSNHTTPPSTMNSSSHTLTSNSKSDQPSPVQAQQPAHRSQIGRGSLQSTDSRITVNLARSGTASYSSLAARYDASLDSTGPNNAPFSMPSSAWSDTNISFSYVENIDAAGGRESRHESLSDAEWRQLFSWEGWPD